MGKADSMSGLRGNGPCEVGRAQDSLLCHIKKGTLRGASSETARRIARHGMKRHNVWNHGPAPKCTNQHLSHTTITIDIHYTTATILPSEKWGAVPCIWGLTGVVILDCT